MQIHVVDFKRPRFYERTKLTAQNSKLKKDNQIVILYFEICSEITDITHNA